MLSSSATIVSCFYQQVLKHPKNIALEYDNRVLTYQELDVESTKFARYLQDMLDLNQVKQDIPTIALCFHRSIEQIIGLFAVLKLGMCYVPIDPEYPQERIQNTIQDCGAQLILTDSGLSARLQSYFKTSDNPPIFIEIDDELLIESYDAAPLDSSMEADAAAYIIYTSGSTGKPKGVVIAHAGVVNLFKVEQAVFDLKPGKKVLNFANYVFDASVWEIFGCLLSGATLCLVDKKELIPGPQLIDTINQKKITHVTLPPSALLAMQPTHFSHLEVMVSAGEACSINLQKLWVTGNYKFFNAYGPTEATVCASIIEITPNNFTENIGHAITNTQLYVLDEQYNLVVKGQVGELFISSIGLAKTYLNRPEITEDVFVTIPYFLGQAKKEMRLYRTGDLVRYIEEGNIVFVGRKDQQIKYHGYRVELGEVESLLNEISAIKHAVVEYQAFANRKEIIAYYQCHSAQTNTVEEELKKILLLRLPEYMVPKFFVQVVQFPLNANGKIDRSQLSITQKLEDGAHIENNQLNYDSKSQLISICQEVIGIERINLEDNFFDLGGHSLLITQTILLIRDRVKVDITVAEFIDAATLYDLLHIIEEKKRQSSGQIGIESAQFKLPSISHDKTHRFEPFPMSDIQQAYYLGRSGYFELSDMSTNVYREYCVAYLDVQKLEQSLNHLIKRHDMLRCRIIGNQSQQIVADLPIFHIEIFDVRKNNDEEILAHLQKIREMMSIKVLPAECPPLLNVKLTRLDNEYRIHICIDALIMDGWSYHLFFDEWEKLYRNPEMKLPELPFTYRDYVLLTYEVESSAQYELDKKYWQNRIATLPLGPSLPLQKSPKEVNNQATRSLSALINSRKWQQIKAFLKKHELRDTSFLISLFTEVISYWSSAEHFTLCLTLFNRLPVDKNINQLIGVFTSLILLEINYTKTKDDSLVGRTKALQNQLYQDLNHRFFTGIEVLRAHRAHHAYAASGTLMPIVFTSFLSASELKNDSALFSVENMSYSSTQTSQVWLDAKVYEEKDNLIIEWDYVEELFPTEMISDMFSAYLRLIDASVEDPDYDLMSNPQLGLLTPPLPPVNDLSGNFIHHEFYAIAQKFPNLVAVQMLENAITYQELADKANLLANHLSLKNTQAQQHVAIIMQRGIEQVIAIMGILKAGAAYVPIDPTFPEQRIQQLLQSANITTIVTNELLSERLAGIVGQSHYRLVSIEGLNPVDDSFYAMPDDFSPDSPAYIIFTSGSTGVPKGVVVSHRSVLNTIHDMNDRYQVNEHDQVLSISNLNFDLSVYDILGLLLKGGTVVMVQPEQEKDPAHWIALMEKYPITIWNTVPMLMQMLLEFVRKTERQFLFTDLRLCLLSGDWVPLSLPEEIRHRHVNPKHLNIIALGGATECSIWSILYEVTSVSSSWKSIPYGFSMKNQSVYVLDNQLQLCPKHVTGEIYIGGMGLATCYLNDPIKTAAYFIIHPKTNQRLYRTGDIGRYMMDGAIEFMGRLDLQVKVGGHRIELEEILIHILQFSDVKNAYVSIIESESNQLKIIAFVINKAEKSTKRLKDYLESVLPEYMLPHQYISLDTFPLTNNGKIDGQYLKELANTHVASPSDNEKSYFNLMEQQLYSIWAQLLKTSHITTHSDFYALGGNSLTLISLMSEINDAFHVDIQVFQLLRLRTLREQANFIQGLIEQSLCSVESEIEAMVE